MSINVKNNSIQSYHLSWGLGNIHNPDVQAVTIIQRATRGFLAKQHLGASQASSIYPHMEKWSEKDIVRFPRIPLSSPSPSPVKIANLLEGTQANEKSAIKKFFSELALRHVNYQRFLNIFQQSLDGTLTFIMSLPPTERGYIIVVDEPQKSNSWMVSLALKQLSAFPPINVVHKESAAGFVSRNRDVRHILLFDDASYSGNQITTTVDVNIFPCLERCKYVKAIHFVIPFLTHRAIEKIAQTAASIYSQTCFLSSHEIMPLIIELPTEIVGVDKNDLLSFQKFLLEKNNVEDSTSLSWTYFDHKIADNVSIPDNAVISVVEAIVPPYKTDFDQIVDQYAKQGMLRVDLLDENGELSQLFVVIKKGDKCYVCTKAECEDLTIERNQINISLQPFEMVELEAGDTLVTETAKVLFDGQNISLM